MIDTSRTIGVLLAISALYPATGVRIAHAADRVMPPAIIGQMRGFVVTRFIISRPATDQAIDCPDGLSMSLRDSFIAQLPPQDRVRAEAITELGKVAQMMLATDNPKNGLKIPVGEPDSHRAADDPLNPFTLTAHTICNNPADFDYVGYHTIDHSGPSSGLNLDGTTDGAPTASTCGHKKFTGVGGTPGVDNQLRRALGCIAVYRASGYDWDSTIHTGDWAILMEVSTPRGGGPDGDVDVVFYSSKDGVTLDASGKIQPGQSLEAIDDPTLIARTYGKIESGVLTTEPVEFTFKYDNQIIHNRWSFEAARFRLEMLPNGGLRGLMGAYADADQYYNYTIKPQTIQGAISNKIDCPGLYASLHALADGDRDPKSGQCRAVSASFDLEAIPAFVIHPQKTAEGGER